MRTHAVPPRLRPAVSELQAARKMLGHLYHADRDGGERRVPLLYRSADKALYEMGTWNPWWQITEALRDLGAETTGEWKVGSTPVYAPLTPGAARIPDGTIDELLGPPTGDRELRHAMVDLIHADRLLAALTETPEIAAARLRCGAAWMLLTGRLVLPPHVAEVR